MNGYVASVVETDREDGYIWSQMPQLSVNLTSKYTYQYGYRGEIEEIEEIVQLLGGFTYRNDIKMIGWKGFEYKKSDPCTTMCWTTSLTVPSDSSQWLESKYTPLVIPRQKMQLVAVQQSKNFLIHFYSPEHIIIVIDEQTQRFCSFSTKSVTFNRYANCAVVGTDIFFVSEDKMAKVENFNTLLIHKRILEQSKQLQMFLISFDINVPHADSTLFVVHNTLCTVGGYDRTHDEPFSDIYQYDQGTKRWNRCGLSSVSRYGPSVVVFTDKNQKESVFVAGGFKGKDVPCSVIEELSVVVKAA